MIRWVTCGVWAAALLAGAAQAGAKALEIVRFEPESTVCRAGRPEVLTALVDNLADRELEVRARLSLPAGVNVVSGPGPATVAAGAQALLRWTVKADAACCGELSVAAEAAEHAAASASVRVSFLSAQEKALPPQSPGVGRAIPNPEPVKTEMLVGAHHCPLWERDKADLWANVFKHPERMPALGLYAQECPEVSDWETKWAVEHGVSFFVYCWYRAAQGCAVKTRYSSAIHEALYKSRFVDKMKYAIMWENQSRGTAGVADERDLFENLLPYWIDNYFRHPSYLKVDGRPVLFIYRPEFLIQDLGGEAAVAKALGRMRQACCEAGFAGLTILGEYRGVDAKHLSLMKRLGLDYTFAYCWPVPNSPPPEQAAAKQLGYIRKTQELGILPQVVTVSQAWSGWRDEGSIWKLPPDVFVDLLQEAKAFAETLPEGQLGRKMLLLDNWNEWGEGHYIAPYREYGFGYLDAVRAAFAPSAGPHADLLPEDVGLGPYDTEIRAAWQAREAARVAARQVVRKPGSDEPGLVAWWAFDEPAASPDVALDYTGGRRGGAVLGAVRTAGVSGYALACTGGCVRVAGDALPCVTSGVTVSCWVRTEVAGQSQAWIVNRIQGGGEDTGFRLGVMEGRPCFNVPLTRWSHAAQAAQPLPLGRWVHLAGTFDGRTVKIYVDGALAGSLDRPGPLRSNGFPLYLASFAAGHAAHFTGLLDEVRLYDRALPADELSQQANSVEGLRR